jgi:DNA recombination protein RmuC
VATVELLWALGGAALGAGVAWTIATLRCRADLERARVTAAEKLAAADARLEQSQALRQELDDRFRALAASALEGSTRQFLELAEQRFAAARQQGKAELDERGKALETLLAPFRETLTRLESRTGEIERARVDAYAKLDKHVELLHKATASLGDQTTSLATALRSSQARGRWGEVALRNVVEAAGMTEHCDFDLQTTLTDGRRPDMVVHLPGGRVIAVDAKAPLEAYLRAAEAADDEERAKALDAHVAALREHVRALASREYAATLGAEIDLVVLFLPGDPFLAAAFRKAPELQLEALRAKVLVATPTTLVALLRTVAIYWQQRSLAENAEAIASAARELYERGAKFSEDLGKVGKGLRTAVDAYNRAVGSFDARFVPMGKRLEDLKVSEQTRRTLAPPEPVEKVAREPKPLSPPPATPPASPA